MYGFVYSTTRLARYLKGLFFAQTFVLSRFRLGNSLKTTEPHESRSIMTAQPAYHLTQDLVSHEVEYDPHSHATTRLKRTKHTCRRCFEYREGFQVPPGNEHLVVTCLLDAGLLPVRRRGGAI